MEAVDMWPDAEDTDLMQGFISVPVTAQVPP